MPISPAPQYWLAELDRYGNPTLIDGAHATRYGAERGLHIRQRLGFDSGKRYAVACVTLSEASQQPEATTA